MNRTITCVLISTLFLACYSMEQTQGLQVVNQPGVYEPKEVSEIFDYETKVMNRAILNGLFAAFIHTCIARPEVV